MQKFDHITLFFFKKNRQIFRRELAKIAENCDHNIGPRLEQTMSGIPAFDCRLRCLAPDAFFSGAPWISHPANGSVLLKPGTNVTILKYF
jgi:hypothetical protein